jgi:haloacid dehalogenase superfamily, subfamily IA, variant 1 with third motif having Dx(3-4)D or Dx(3-4)E
MSYDGLVLDHDGVLVGMAASATIEAAVEAAFAAAGVPEPRPADVDALGMGVEADQVRAVAERHGVDPATLWDHREQAVHERLLAAVREEGKAPYDDVAALAELDCPFGVASNNQARTVEFILDYHGLEDHFGTVKARTSTFESLATMKPHPALVESAVEALPVDDPLYVGDSETDVLAARRAGVDVAFLRRPHNADRAVDPEPTHDVESLRAVAALLD